MENSVQPVKKSQQWERYRLEHRNDSSERLAVRRKIARLQQPFACFRCAVGRASLEDLRKVCLRSTVPKSLAENEKQTYSGLAEHTPFALYNTIVSPFHLFHVTLRVNVFHSQLTCGENVSRSNNFSPGPSRTFK